MKAHALICPVCSEDLSIDEQSCAKYKSVSCKHNHLFDFAKQGYLNLLLSQHKKSKHPGDTTEMVQARTHFLDSGFYEGICNFLITQLISKHLSTELINRLNPQTFHYCDIACGEGYYTHRIHQYLLDLLARSANNISIHSTGLDISTPAIKAACKRSKDIQWLIASLARSPIEDDSQDLVTGLFFHFDQKELKRILKPGGVFIMVTTGPDHLIELREIIYDTVKEEKPKQFIDSENALKYVETLKMRDTQLLTNNKDIMSLFSMTPHYWRSTQEKKNNLEALSSLSVTLDIQFDIFRK